MLDDLGMLVIGAGPAGCTAAWLGAESGRKVLVVERKNHVAGHCHDYLNRRGIYVHAYGPHIFHTDSREVWEFLSRFTEWHEYQHKVLGFLDGNLAPIPFNLNTLEACFSASMADRISRKLIDEFGFGNKSTILELRERKDSDLTLLADYVYEKVFLHYTLKQWDSEPEKIDPSVSARVPVRISRDDRYFTNRWQGIPRNGYTALFRSMLDHPSIRLLLDSDGSEVLTLTGGKTFLEGRPFEGPVVYTGPVDELFGFRHGELPYRSVDVRIEDRSEDHFQDAAVVNYPNSYDFTRITEFKKFQANGTALRGTTICREYPEAYERGRNNPYYVVACPESREMYDKYRAEASGYPNLLLLGRLAEYRYYDMDQAVAAALRKTGEILGR